MGGVNLAVPISQVVVIVGLRHHSLKMASIVSFAGGGGSSCWLKVFRYDGDGWVQKGSTVTDSNSGYVHTTGTSFQRRLVHRCAPHLVTSMDADELYIPSQHCRLAKVGSVELVLGICGRHASQGAN